MEHTFIIIKPDAIERGLIGEIISRFERRGFVIKRIALRSKNCAWCTQHYQHLDLNIYHKLLHFMTHTPLLGIILEGSDVLRTVREMIGCTNCLEATSGTIRGDFGGSPVYENLIHASDSVEAVTREIKLFTALETDCDDLY